ncbi:patatin-like phospholipase family protein [Roseateles sp.]|uniref:patatin-like phospholipase family protein n=1 Tax=Roseateles sp. TaxID=1971397 RepID=UPI003BA807E3
MTPLFPALLLILGLGLNGTRACAQSSEDAATPKDPARPKVGLVLSGGGVRGLAHIGVLRVLQDLRVPVDLVVGTSMGAVVGGAYASGRKIEELEDFVRRTDWPAIMADRPPRQNLSFRRREEDQGIPSRIELGLHRKTGMSLPPAAAGNSSLEFALERLVPPLQAESPISQMNLPFRAVATDLLSGEMLEMVDTPLFLAMRASMAIPGVFTPVRINGRAVVDGGLVRNLGIDIARKMGAEVIIAVNVGSPLLEEREITSAVGVANQMLQILTNQNVAQSLKGLRPNDVLIDPDLGDIAFMDFSRYEESISSGQRGAMAAHERLRALSVSPEAYAEQELRRLQQPRQPAKQLPLASLTLRGTKHTDAEALKAEVDLPLGKPTGLAEIQKAAANLYGRGDFERIDTQISDENGRRQVTLNLTEADWASSRLRVGLELYSDFDEANRFSLSVMHVWTWLNRWGAELRTTGTIGAKRNLGMEFFQPLGPGSPWFATAEARYGSENADIFNEKGLRQARIHTNMAGASFALGRQLGNWGDVRWNFGRARVRAVQAIPEDPAERGQAWVNQQSLRFRADTLDSVAFPSRGFLIDANFIRQRPDGVTVPNDYFSLQGLSAFRLGQWAGHVYGEAASTKLDGNVGELGGFLRLSGSPRGSLNGSNVGMGRGVWARNSGQLPLGRGTASGAGFALDAGAILKSNEKALLTLPDGKLAGSLFLAIDTRFGPFYLAAGSTYRGQSSLYLFLGPIW